MTKRHPSNGRPPEGGSKQSFAQFVKFNAVGVLNTAVDFAAFAVLTRFGLYVLAAQVLSYSAGIVNSYLFNNYWTFAEREKKADPAQAIRFIVLNLGSLGLSLVLLYLFHDRIGLGSLVSKAIVTVFTTAVNFAGAKWWVFRQNPKPGAA